MLLFLRSLILRRGGRELLRDLDLEVRAGERWAVIGPNGVGKSTLLAVLGGGRLGATDEGDLRRAPGVWTATVEQGQADPAALPADATLLDLAAMALRPLEELGADLARLAADLGETPDPTELDRYGRSLALFELRGGYRMREALDEALARIGLARAGLRPLAEASEGERRRARLAGALASGAELLVLDEPSNHLDILARAWLARRLRAHRGGLVFASHDRALIDAVATHVLRLGPGPVQKLRGGYAEAERQHHEQGRAEDKAERARRKRVAELEAMARELQAHGHRGAQVRRLRAERELRGLQPPERPAAEGSSTPRMRFGVADARRGADRKRHHEPLARFEHLSHGSLLQDVHLSIASGERLAIVGPNGSGKSTMLAMIEGLLPSDDPRSSRWWRQGTSLLRMGQSDRGLPDDVTPREALMAWVGGRQAEDRLAQSGLPPATWDRQAAALSGGERARAGLALLMSREADLLLLDEPTNDLDLPAIEALETALRQTPAALVLVSHDAHLVEAVGAEVLSIEDGRLLRWRAGLQGWRRGQRRLEEGLGTPIGAEATAASASSTDMAQGAASAEASADGTSAHEKEPGADEEAYWAEEVATAEAAMADPRRWSERDLLRWRQRRKAAEEAIIGHWEHLSAAPPPQPPFRTREEGMVLWAERQGDGLRAWLDGAEQEPLASAELRVVGTTAEGEGGRPALRVGHLVLPRANDRELTPWAFRALVRGAARLAFYLTAVDLVQLADPRDPGGFEPLAPGWWLWRRRAMERSEGWRRR